MEQFCTRSTKVCTAHCIFQFLCTDFYIYLSLVPARVTKFMFFRCRQDRYSPSFNPWILVFRLKKGGSEVKPQRITQFYSNPIVFFYQDPLFSTEVLEDWLRFFLSTFHRNADFDAQYFKKIVPPRPFFFAGERSCRFQLQNPVFFLLSR